MTQLALLEYPDKRLRLTCKRVDSFDEELNQFVDNMIHTLRIVGGIGLSAPQCGDARRVVVLDLSDDQTEPQVYINPEILQQKKPGIIQESCLSVPGVTGNVMRCTQLKIKAENRSGERFESDLTAMNAVAMLHEIDHLDGKLFIDRMSVFGRFRYRRKLAALRAAADL